MIFRAVARVSRLLENSNCSSDHAQVSGPCSCALASARPRTPKISSSSKQLTRSAGALPVVSIGGRRDRPDPRFFVGSGKADEIRAAAVEHNADVVLFDHPLSPSQERNLEKLIERRVLDRSGLILDIFAQRARSHEGKLEVELAQLKHIASRLVRGWTHLERQRGGGIGNRGPGETQLETDRRLLGKRVKTLTARLEKIKQQRETGRQQRAEIPDSVARAGGLHQRRQVHAVPRAHRRRCLHRRPVVRDARSHRAQHHAAGQYARSWWPTPSGSSASCRTSWWRRSSRRSPKRARPRCCCTWSTSAIRGATNTSTKSIACWPRSAPPTCRRSWCSTRSTASTRRRASNATNPGSVSHVWLSAAKAAGLDGLLQVGRRTPRARGAARDAAPAGVGRRAAGAAVCRRTWCAPSGLPRTAPSKSTLNYPNSSCSNGRASPASKF